MFSSNTWSNLIDSYMKLREGWGNDKAYRAKCWWFSASGSKDKQQSRRTVFFGIDVFRFSSVSAEQLLWYSGVAYSNYVNSPFHLTVISTILYSAFWTSPEPFWWNFDNTCTRLIVGNLVERLHLFHGVHSSINTKCVSIFRQIEIMMYKAIYLPFQTRAIVIATQFKIFHAVGHR